MQSIGDLGFLDFNKNLKLSKIYENRFLDFLEQLIDVWLSSYAFLNLFIDVL